MCNKIISEVSLPYIYTHEHEFDSAVILTIEVSLPLIITSNYKVPPYV